MFIFIFSDYDNIVLRFYKKKRSSSKSSSKVSQGQQPHSFLNHQSDHPQFVQGQVYEHKIFYIDIYIWLLLSTENRKAQNCLWVKKQQYHPILFLLFSIIYLFPYDCFFFNATTTDCSYFFILVVVLPSAQLFFSYLQKNYIFFFLLYMLIVAVFSLFIK